MTCSICRAACIAGGNLCAPLDWESREAATEAGIDPDAFKREHVAAQHKMALSGPVWRCEYGHTMDATGYEMMKAAGIPPML